MTVVWQEYETRVSDEFVLRGNAAILKCSVPSYVSDAVTIEAWISDQGELVDAKSGKFGRTVQNHKRTTNVSVERIPAKH